MKLGELKVQRLDNSGRRERSQVRILHELKMVTPNGLTYNRLLEQINKSAEATKIPKMSTRTLSRNLKLLVREGAIVVKEGVYYISPKGFQTLLYLINAKTYENLLRDPATILIGQELKERGNALESFTVLRRTEKSSDLSEEIEKQVENITNDYLEDLKALLAKGYGFEIKIQATITDKKRDPLSIYSFTDLSEQQDKTA